MTMVINGSGSITGLSAGGLPDSTIVQADLATGVAGTGPAFSAYQSSAQAFTVGVNTKVGFQTEEFDTASCFNNTGSTVGGIPAYAFLPNVAGYYQIDVAVRFVTSAGNNYVTLYKTGSQDRILMQGFPGLVDGSSATLVYLNGSTDYIEIYMNDGGGGTTSPYLKSMYFSAFLARAA